MRAGEGCSGQEKSKSECPGVRGMVRNVRVAGTEGQNKELRPEESLEPGGGSIRQSRDFDLR